VRLWADVVVVHGNTSVGSEVTCGRLQTYDHDMKIPRTSLVLGL
jgi:hypothetical protein